MNEYPLAWTAMSLIFILPALAPPAIVGLIILLRYRRDPVSAMAGVFTLKPVLATPLWLGTMAIAAGLPRLAIPALGLLPGVSLTLLIVLAFKRSLKTVPKVTGFLIVGDALRWLNAFVYAGVVAVEGSVAVYLCSTLLGVLVPTAYAAMALVLVLNRAAALRTVTA